ncbi:uncharacterized protein [Solanum lycopersicum]|uniref:uncharacterized protein n=1 Tax=Solanum lycopersicum TaxID=4081 RepID=UPI00374974D4
MTLQVLQEHQMYAKFSKCEFWLRAMTFHSHIVSDQGVEADLKKMKSVNNWLRHLTPIDIRSFLGLDNYYCKFVKGFSAIAAPLTALAKKKDGKAIAYASTLLKIHEKNYPTHDLELAVVVFALNLMTKSTYYIHVKSTYRSRDYAKLYIDEIVRYHGIHLSINLDRGAQFTSHFWRSFQKSLGTQVKLNTDFHPQTDGQAERNIETHENMMRECVIEFKGSWDDHLALIEFSYDNCYNSSIGMEPLETLYGRRCRSPVGWFEVEDSSILVFHVSMLKKCLGDPASILLGKGSRVDENLYYEEVPIEILDCQVKKLRNKVVATVKGLWWNLCVKGATWEAEADMRSRHPHLFSS